MIDAQTWLVAVAACVVIAAVWAWGIVREDAAVGDPSRTPVRLGTPVVRAHAGGIADGRALERTPSRGAIVADTTTTDPATAMPRFGDATDCVRPVGGESESLADAAPSTLSAGGGAGQPDAPVRRAIPAWLRGPGGSGEGD